jgi:hypothetical protein
MQALPTHLADFIRTNGGVGNWLGKAEPASDSRAKAAEKQAIVDDPTDI